MDHHEIIDRLREIEREIAQGWLIYGRFMDADKTRDDKAVDVRKLIALLTEEKAKLTMMIEPDAATQFITKHKELLDGKVG